MPSLRTFAPLMLAAVVAACSGPAKRPPATETPLAASNIPAAIAVPAGNKLAFQFHASGFQNYECRAKPETADGHDWVFVSPEAALYDRSDMRVGRHYSGPTWEYGDDSKVSGKVVADSAAPRAGNIPWLLLQGTPAPRNGVMSGVTYIQRVNTDGGVAPTEPCGAANAGTRKQVTYSADYLFYKG